MTKLVRPHTNIVSIHPTIRTRACFWVTVTVSLLGHSSAWGVASFVRLADKLVSLAIVNWSTSYESCFQRCHSRAATFSLLSHTQSYWEYTYFNVTMRSFQHCGQACTFAWQPYERVPALRTRLGLQHRLIIHRLAGEQTKHNHYIQCNTVTFGRQRCKGIQCNNF